MASVQVVVHTDAEGNGTASKYLYPNIVSGRDIQRYSAAVINASGSVAVYDCLPNTDVIVEISVDK